jgi:hypothetical protein
MLPTGFFAVAVGVACFVLIAVVSMRGTRRRRRFRDGGALFPIGDDFGGDDFGGGK